MSKIYAKLFGVPQILKDGEKVFFPYAKINALIYYILINKVVSRDEIAGLLWPDENEKIAKKNLRNALYQSKKSLDMDFIISPKKSILVLNDDLNIECDVNLFIEDPIKNSNLYDGDFLQGFFLKEAESYEYWITKMRNLYQDKFTNISYKKIESNIENGIYENVEKDINALTQIDEFDERNFRLLMKFYQKTGRNGKVVETYYDLSKLLQNELGVEPDRETKKIYEESIKQININNSRPKIVDYFFYGRYNEIAKIEDTLKSFSDNKPAKSIFIRGEAGIGKSSLKRKILENKEENFIILESFCYQAEENYALRPFGIIIDKMSKVLKEFKIPLPTFWGTTMSKLFPSFDESSHDIKLLESKEPLKFDLLTQVIVEAAKKINEKKKLLIVFEDIQWMDQTSLKLLTSVMLHLKDEAIFILTARKQFNLDVDDLLTSLERYDKIETIELERFNHEESLEFILKSLPDREIQTETLEKIYLETEGNSFFLSEYVNLIKSDDQTDLMTSKMVDAIKSRFLYLSKSEKDLLDIVSFFYDEAPIETICEITGQGEFDIIGLLEELEKRNILTEVVHKNHIGLIFTHTKLREYVYMIQPNSKKKIVHKRIGEILEAKLEQKKKDPYIYSKLVYHYSSAGEDLKALKYKIETLNYYLNFSHELFPILNFSELEQDEKIYISRDKIQDMFEKLSENFAELMNKERSEELKTLEVEFFYMKGRYMIRDGNYGEGLDDIRYVIQKAGEIGNRDYVLDGYKQMIFYNIQTNNSHDMIEYIELALDLAVKCNYHKEIGILLRLKGLYNIMIGNYFIAEKLLTESINTFKVTDEVANRYAINIAAAYNYIGELRFATGDYEDATEQFKAAIDLSKNKNALSSLSIFYINMGKAYFALDNVKKAEEYFYFAYNLYGQFDSFWKRPVLDSYMALTEIRLKKYSDSVLHIKSALEFAEKLKDPRDLGTVYFAHYMISKMAQKDTVLFEIYKDILKETADSYKDKSLNYLDAYRDAYEINRIITK
ncbi:AAA family ATPase [Peptoniphilus sp. oral taxon 386]|uniref:AAA family ATPase n=1 Tax=Peptoniphilus sp. oral taxon 386 TaxID=652713 RepID=UPI0001DA9F64|nr:AAA family ATPase [Peptoniphilus sp. oral taxon 386]EFI41563.1 tetratricopeptide repeat protein [Peptoniphilus sp. oral taxon 386 str. F0131]